MPDESVPSYVTDFAQTYVVDQSSLGAMLKIMYSRRVTIVSGIRDTSSR